MLSCRAPLGNATNTEASEMASHSVPAWGRGVQGELSRVDVCIPMPDYKSLSAVLMISAILDNIQQQVKRSVAVHPRGC